MKIRAQLYCHKEPNKWDRRGYIYCWYYRVYDANTGNVLASDNSGDYRSISSQMVRDLEAIWHCARLGILKKSRGW